MTRQRVLLILGGMFHDFEGFAATIRPVVESAGYSLTATYDLDELTGLDGGAYDIVMSDTSLSRHREGQPSATPETLTPDQTEGLVRWVRAGGALVGVHSATVSGIDNAAFRSLLGARFVSHPPQFVFSVTPTFREHPITAGVEAFTVKDEMYVQDYDPSIDIHMVTVDRGVAYPMVWSRTEGKGRVAHVSMGHGPQVWCLPQFRTLILQSLAWASETRG